MDFSVRVITSLSAYTDAQLDLVTSGCPVFFDRRWFRFIDAMKLEPLVRGEIKLQ